MTTSDNTSNGPAPRTKQPPKQTRKRRPKNRPPQTESAERSRAGASGDADVAESAKKPRKPFRWRPWFWVLAVALLGGGLPMLLASQLKTDIRSTNANRIRAMSSNDRLRLEKNLDDYSSLPPQEQQRVQQVHRDINGDPNLQTTLADYLAWLKTLSLSDWDRIHQTDDPARRALAVSRISSERIESRARFDRIIAQEATSNSSFRRGFPAIELPEADLQGVMTFLENELPPSMKPPSDMPTALRRVEILKATTRNLRSGGGNMRSGWFSEQFFEGLTKALVTESVTRRVQSIPENLRRFALPMLIVRSVKEQLFREYAPSDSALRAFSQQMPPEFKERILRNPDPADAKGWLQMGYLFSEAAPTVQQAFREITRIENEFRPRPPNGGRDRGNDRSRRDRGEGRDRDDDGPRNPPRFPFPRPDRPGS